MLYGSPFAEPQEDRCDHGDSCGCARCSATPLDQPTFQTNLALDAAGRFVAGPQEWLRLAMAALDQGDVPASVQKKILKLIA